MSLGQKLLAIWENITPDPSTYTMEPRHQEEIPNGTYYVSNFYSCGTGPYGLFGKMLLTDLSTDEDFYVWIYRITLEELEYADNHSNPKNKIIAVFGKASFGGEKITITQTTSEGLASIRRTLIL